MTQIKVGIVEFGDRRHYQMQYMDPLSGRKKTRSTKVKRTGRKRDRDDLKAAAKWEKELHEGTYQPPTRIKWEDFRERYETEVLPSLAVETGNVVFTVFNTVEKILAPVRLADLTADRLSYFQAELRAGARSEATIRTYLAHLKSALRWSVDVGLLRALPKITRPPRAKSSKVMKGRPITTEEFERMLGKVADVVLYKRHNPKPPREPKPPTPAEISRDLAIVARWKFFLRGLWLSGLRLGESLELYWDRPDRLRIDLVEGKRPMMRIPAALEKGNQDRILPLSPEFAELLMLVPEGQRMGRVFKLLDRGGCPRQFGGDWIGRVISAIGKKANVVVNTAAKGVKYASAHDLRRSFGERWAPRVMPQVLKELMRHESIETTLRYYVGRNAETTANVLWAAHETAGRSGNSFGNNVPKVAVAQANGSTQAIATSSLQSRGDRI